MSLERQLMRLTLRQLGELVEVQIESTDEERAGFEKFLEIPLRLLAREFRSRAALRVFVLRKLEQAESRKHARAIAAIFDAA